MNYMVLNYGKSLRKNSFFVLDDLSFKNGSSQKVFTLKKIAFNKKLIVYI